MKPSFGCLGIWLTVIIWAGPALGKDKPVAEAGLKSAVAPLRAVAGGWPAMP